MVLKKKLRKQKLDRRDTSTSTLTQSKVDSTTPSNTCVNNDADLPKLSNQSQVDTTSLSATQPSFSCPVSPPPSTFSQPLKEMFPSQSTTSPSLPVEENEDAIAHAAESDASTFLSTSSSSQGMEGLGASFSSNDIVTETKINLTKQEENEEKEIENKQQGEVTEEDEVVKPIQVTVRLPNNSKLTFPALRTDVVAFVLQSVIDHPSLVSYSCSNLCYQGQHLPETQDLGSILANAGDVTTENELVLELKPSVYGERDLRVHLMRIRNLVFQHSLRIHPGHFALDSGLALLPTFSKKDPELSESTYPVSGEGSGKRYVFHWDQSELGPLLNSYASAPSDFGVVTLGISGWNPPPAWRRIRGDFLYVQASFSDSETYHITGTHKGFYKNRSTNTFFDPTSDSPTFHSLLDLLSDLSPTFQNQFEKWLPTSTDMTPNVTPEKLPILTTLPQPNWLVHMYHSKEDHLFDPFRGLGGLSGGETMLDATSMDSARDWNEELQLYRTQLFPLPATTTQDGTTMEGGEQLPRPFVHLRQYNIVYTQFVHMAIQGALGILSGSIPPISLPDSDRQDDFLYFWNNLFFSFAEANTTRFQSEGHLDPALAARVHAAKDLKAIQQIESHGIAGIHMMPLVIVDIQGHRILVQGLLPGVIGNPNGAKIVYGSVEDPEQPFGTIGQRQVKSDPEFHAMLREVADKMMWKEHRVADEKNGDIHTLYSSAETKGILGHDGRHYLFDLARSAPLDKPFLEIVKSDGFLPYLHQLVLFRYELLSAYQEYLTQTYLKDIYLKEKERISQLPQDATTVKSTASSSASASSSTFDSSSGLEALQLTLQDPTYSSNVTSVDNSSASAGKEKESAESEALVKLNFSELLESAPTFRFNPDRFSSWCAEKEEPSKELNQLYTYLYKLVIPSFVDDLSKVVSIPTSGINLTNILHSRGISMRHLGLVLSAVEKEHYAKKNIPGIRLRLDALTILLKREMWVRCFKHVVRHYLKLTVKTTGPTLVIAHLITAFLGITSFPDDASSLSSEVWTQKLTYPASYTDITPSFLTSLLLQQVSIRYRYQIKTSLEFQSMKQVMLREGCLRLGVQLIAKKYAPHFVVQEEDVLNLVPLVKTSPLKHSMCQTQLEFAQTLMQNGKFANGLAALEHAFYMYEQSYSPMHLDTLFVQSCLADAYHTLFNDQKESMYLQRAIELQQSAVIGFERLAGVDSYEAASGYFVLSTMEFSAGLHSQALLHLTHAAQLYHIVYGPEHPDWMPHLSLFARLFTKFNRLDLAVHVWSLMKDYYIHHFGPEEAVTATSYFQLSQYLFADGQHKSALTFAKNAYVIWMNKLGMEDPRTKEAAQLLNEMTKQWVQARTVTPAVSASTTSASLNPSSSTSAGKPAMNGNKKKPNVSQPKPTASDTETPKVSPKVSLSIEEQIAYINGDSKRRGTQPKKAHKSAHHGKSKH